MATFPVARGANGQPPSPPLTHRGQSRRPRPRPRRRQRRCGACRGNGRRPGRRGSTSARRAAAPDEASQPRSCPRARPRRRRRDEPVREVGNDTGSTSPSNGQPNATLIVAVEGRSASGEDRARPGRRHLQRGVAVALVEDSVAASVTLTRSSAVAASALPAVLVEDEPGELGPTSPTAETTSSAPPSAARARDRRSSPPRSGQAGRGEADGRARRESRAQASRLVLQPVARPDVAERDVHARSLFVLERFERVEPCRAASRQ